MKVLVFASSDQKRVYAEAAALVRALSNGPAPLQAERVNKLSNRVDDLLRVATHGVVEPAVVVIETAPGVAAFRAPRLLSAPKIREVARRVLELASA